MSVTALPEEVWREYVQTRDPKIQSQIVTHYASVVVFVSRLVGQRLPAHVDRDELVSLGNLGLLDAIEKYDPDKGVQFKTYAMMRIRGAIVDGLRSADWVPRTVRSQAREVDKASRAFELENGRAPTMAEVAAATGYSAAQLSKLSQEVMGANFLPLDAQVSIGTKGDRISEAEAIQDIRAETPEDAAALMEVRMEIAERIPQMNEQLRIVMTLHYYDGLSFGEVAAALKVTESRVCQLNSHAMGAFSRTPF